ncbi:hypothetical protein ACWEQN_32570 [Streptomyces sp. NPDC004129]
MASNQQTKPGIGELAKDSATGRIGVVMGEFGGRVQIRPIGGGTEWDGCSSCEGSVLITP